MKLDYDNEDKMEIENEVVDSRHHIGDTITFDNGMDITILDVGKLTDETFRTYVYIEIECKNNGADSLGIGSAVVDFYGDEYLINEDSSYPLVDNVIGFEEVDPGRKIKGICVARCEQYDNYSVIEAQIGNSVIVVKDDNSVNSSTQYNNLDENNGASDKRKTSKDYDGNYEFYQNFTWVGSNPGIYAGFQFYNECNEGTFWWIYISYDINGNKEYTVQYNGVFEITSAYNNSGHIYTDDGKEIFFKFYEIGSCPYVSIEIDGVTYDLVDEEWVDTLYDAG